MRDTPTSNTATFHVAHTAEGVAAFTHASWTGEGSTEDPYADMDQAARQPRQVIAVADFAIPSHGPAFIPSDANPR